MFLARRAAWQAQTADPSLPVGAAIAFSIYKLFDKRKKRAPEGDTSGRSHIWGAVGVTIFGLVLGSLVSTFSHFLRLRLLGDLKKMLTEGNAGGHLHI